MTPPPPASRDKTRLWQVDALRGLMLMLMTVTHVPTRFSSPLGQPFGYVSAAEGFVFLSAFMAGLVYSRKQSERGDGGVRSALLKRVLRIYLSQVVLLVFLFSAVAAIGLLARQSAVTDLVSFYLERPAEAIVGALLLVYNPPLLDILPMYVLFMLASSLLLVAGMRRGWGWILGLSIALWLAAQFGLRDRLYDAAVAATRFGIPEAQIGAFDVLAWQLLWTIGLWLGWRRASGQPQPRFPGWMVAAAAAVALVFFAWRHAVGQAPFLGDPALEPLLDKWRLGPLRLLDLLALVVLLMHFAPGLQRVLPRLRVLETLGAASLPVFCAHLCIALLTLALLGAASPERPWPIDVAVLAVTFAVLYAVARVSAALDRHSARVRAAFAARRAAATNAAPDPRLSAGEPRSRPSRSRSPRR